MGRKMYGTWSVLGEQLAGIATEASGTSIGIRHLIKALLGIALLIE